MIHFHDHQNSPIGRKCPVSQELCMCLFPAQGDFYKCSGGGTSRAMTSGLKLSEVRNRPAASMLTDKQLRRKASLLKLFLTLIKMYFLNDTNMGIYNIHTTGPGSPLGPYKKNMRSHLENND